MLNKLSNAWGDLRHRSIYHVGLRLSASGRLPSTWFLMDETEILCLDRLNTRALERTPVGYEWLCADPALTEDLLACSPAAARPTLRGVFENFFHKGARCYVARREHRVVAYVWAFSHHYVLTFDDYKSRNLNVRLDGNTVFLGNGMIDEKHRLRGLFPQLMAFVIAQWPGGMQFYSAVDRTNERSLLSHYRLGFVPCKQVLCLTLLGMTWFFKRATPKSRWTRQCAECELAVPPPLSPVPEPKSG